VAKIGRNAPCPCGSGQKYKNCHLGLANDPARTASAEAATPAPLTERPGWTQAIPWVIGCAGTALAVWAFTSASTTAGLSAIAATALVICGWYIFGNPPPPKDDAGDPAGLNFGR